MANKPEEVCRHCGHTRKEHMIERKGRSNVKKRRPKGGGPKDTYRVTFRNCDRFEAESST